MAARAPDEDRLRARLDELVGTPLAIEPIESGTSGQSYRVETRDGRFAVKAFFDDADLLLGPSAQFGLLERIAPADIAPEPVACDEARGLLVTRWIDDGRPARPEELTGPDRIRTLAGVLGTLHALDCPVPDYRPRDYAGRQLARLGGRQNLGRADRSRLAELEALAAELDADPARRLCHNDLAADNCLLGMRCRLIDFDFAAAAPPILDLASLAEMNRFDAAASRVLLDAYYGEVAAHLERLARVRRLLALVAHFWALAATAARAAIVAPYRIDDD